VGDLLTMEKVTRELQKREAVWCTLAGRSFRTTCQKIIERSRSALTQNSPDQHFANMFWKCVMPQRLSVAPVLLEPPGCNSSHSVGDRPLWCSLVTRSIGMKSKEADCPGARAAVAKELAGHSKKGTWDLSTVMEHSALMRDRSPKDVMVGRVFGILGIKNSELDLKDQEFKCRAVYDGGNVHTRSGVDARELYEEIANAPASFTAARCAIAAAVLTKKSVSVRDALQAFLQARIDSPGRVQTWVELPKEWWPAEWFWDAARTQPKYRRPVVLLLLALYGHPESGALWDAKLIGVLVSLGWTCVPDWSGTFIHADMSILVAYVDDLMLCALPDLMVSHWSAIEKLVEFKEGPSPLARYLGASYNLDNWNPAVPDAPRTLKVHMAEYSRNAVRKFSEEYGRNFNKAATPYVTEKEWADSSEVEGVFKRTCASHAATSLFLGRVGRPDLSCAVQRLCSAVARWTVVEDLALTRLIAYLNGHCDFELVSKLSPLDCADLEIMLYTDADWNGDAATTRSTSGMWIELASKSSDHKWAVAWSTSKQTSTASSTCEAETVSLSSGLRKDGLPVQLLLECFLGIRVPIRCLVDNDQAIAAVKRGYSKRLRHLARTQRVAIGVLHECTNDFSMCVSIEHCPSSLQKGDMFTKALHPAPFVAARDSLGLFAREPA
jgi:hypothetical protein